MCHISYFVYTTGSKRTRDAIAGCLPNHNLGILVPVLERFVVSVFLCPRFFHSVSYVLSILTGLLEVCSHSLVEPVNIWLMEDDIALCLDAFPLRKREGIGTERKSLHVLDKGKEGEKILVWICDRE